MQTRAVCLVQSTLTVLVRSHWFIYRHSEENGRTSRINQKISVSYRYSTSSTPMPPPPHWSILRCFFRLVRTITSLHSPVSDFSGNQLPAIKLEFMQEVKSLLMQKVSESRLELNKLQRQYILGFMVFIYFFKSRDRTQNCRLVRIIQK